MQQKLRGLPSLTALRTFEVAARYCSFKQAAEELCVTQAAVSRQVRQLETQLDVELFVRSHRRVDLTEQGTKLFQTVHRSLADIAAISYEMQSGPRLNNINLYATSSFSRLWLVPRLNQLRRAHSQVHLHLISVEENPAMSDKFDAGITLGLEDNNAYQSDFLFSEDVFPVCTQVFLEANPTANSIEGLMQLPLLELDAKFWNAKWWSAVDWSFWFDQQGLDCADVSTDISFSHFPMLLDAVLQDVGVGLSWQHLVQDMLDDGRLIQPVIERYSAPERKHYFVCRKDLAEKPEMKLLRAWLLEQTAIFRM
ncbi:LysR substrate-binding domain-containing protein [Neptunomonas japonica]|uniref:LysR substrate-binding domain-containing protein n=1 Tax=Neptunomonas japonica TaxID=417574 RepID=UPI000491A8FB|nr:LysR substrate-binding domain-containing protein [Neptunomonas japonica]